MKSLSKLLKMDLFKGLGGIIRGPAPPFKKPVKKTQLNKLGLDLSHFERPLQAFENGLFEKGIKGDYQGTWPPFKKPIKNLLK